MEILKYTLRRPVNTILGILFLVFSGALLYLSAGQYIAAIQTRENLAGQYTTIALPTNEYRKKVHKNENGETISVTYFSGQPYEVQKLLEELPERYPDIIKAREESGLISAYCEQIEPLNYTNEEGAIGHGGVLTRTEIYPYDQAILTVKLTKIDEPDSGKLIDEESAKTTAEALAEFLGTELEKVYQEPEEINAGRCLEVQLEGTVLDVVALQEGFASPVGYTIQIRLKVASKEEFEAMGLQLGKTYLVYGSDYTDNEYSFRRNLAGQHEEYWKKLSFDNIQYFSEDELDEINEGKNPVRDADSYYVAMYEETIDGKLFRWLFTQSELDTYNNKNLIVWSSPVAATSQLDKEKIWISDGTKVTQQEYNQLYQRAAIVEIPEGETVDLDALGQLWSSAYQTVQINNHALPVVGTNNLQSMVQFAKQETFISAGRTITQEEYANGSRVCVLSETLAEANGLQVGDTITLQYYQKDDDLPEGMMTKSSNPVPERYSSVKSFCSEPMEYEIVGLYRQTNEWSENEYSFTPNTVFVPENSVVGEMVYQSSGILSTFVLENGMTEKMDEELIELGYEGLFAYYDQGYAEVSESIVTYCTVARRILLVGALCWCVLLVLYALLFPARQAQDARRMWTLGTPKVQVLGYYVKTSVCLALPGSLLGSALAVYLMPIVLAKIDQTANVSLSLSGQWKIYLLLGAVQLVCAALAAYIVGRRETGPLYQGQDVRKR